MANGDSGAMGGIKDRVGDLLGKFTTAQKALMGGITVAVFVAIFLFTKAASSPDLAPLYSNLKAADAAAVTEKLTSEGVTYTLADAGGTILIERSKVYDTRLKLAAEGLPESGPEGYSLLDKQGITTSEFAQQVGYQRAMEGELSKTINSMDPVDTSTVHLAIPKDNVFAGEQSKATASVMVKTKPGKTLDSMQVQAIVHLVASSVNGLDPAAVTVADATGQVLAAPGQDGSALNAADLNTKQQAAYEKAKAQAIQTLIEPVVGAGKAKVTVSADLDFNKKNTTSEVFRQPSGNADQATPQSQTQKTEQFQGAGTGDAGVLGPDGATTGANGGNGTTNYTLQENTQKNALDRTVDQTVQAPGQVKRLSVAVLLDSGSTSADQVTQIQDLVTAAAGLSQARGDPVPAVTRLPFSNAEADALAKAEEEARAAEAQQATMGMVRQGAVVLFLLALLFLVYRSMRKATRRQVPTLYAGDVREIEPPKELEAPTPKPEERLVLERPHLDLPPEPLDPGPTKEELHREKVQRQVENMIDNQPVEVAQMLRTWLGEGKKAAKK